MKTDTYCIFLVITSCFTLFGCNDFSYDKRNIVKTLSVKENFSIEWYNFNSIEHDYTEFVELKTKDNQKKELSYMKVTTFATYNSCQIL